MEMIYEFGNPEPIAIIDTDGVTFLSDDWDHWLPKWIRRASCN